MKIKRVFFNIFLIQLHFYFTHFLYFAMSQTEKSIHLKLNVLLIVSSELFDERAILESKMFMLPCKR